MQGLRRAILPSLCDHLESLLDLDLINLMQRIKILLAITTAIRVIIWHCYSGNISLFVVLWHPATCMRNCGTAFAFLHFGQSVVPRAGFLVLFAIAVCSRSVEEPTE